MVRERSIDKKENQKLKADVEDLQKYIEDFTTFLPIAVCDVTPIGIITFVNKALQELVDYKEIDIVGEPVETLFLEKKEIEKILAEVSKKEIIRNEELTLISKMEKKISVSLFISSRKDKEGNFLGYFLGIIDISELKKLQEEMEAKIEERTKELREKIEELEKINRLTVGRELKMIGLKEEIKELKEELEKGRKTKEFGNI